MGRAKTNATRDSVPTKAAPNTSGMPGLKKFTGRERTGAGTPPVVKPAFDGPSATITTER